VQCNPNFEGAGVSIIDGGVEWGVSPAVAGTVLNRILGGFPLNATAEWHVEQTGAYPPTYIVKYAHSFFFLAATGIDRDSGKSTTTTWWSTSVPTDY
jgi:hypothetical protein